MPHSLKDKSVAQQRVLHNQKWSIEVYFVRPGDLRPDGSVAANNRNPSSRRFGSQEEATHHALRFVAKENHAGFYTVKSHQRPNAWVNWKTGLTNPVINQ